MLTHFFLMAAGDGEMLVGLPKVKVLRNDRREGTLPSFSLLFLRQFEK